MARQIPCGFGVDIAIIRDRRPVGCIRCSNDMDQTRRAALHRVRPRSDDCITHCTDAESAAMGCSQILQPPPLSFST